MKICPNCGKSFEDTQKFCGECGTVLVEQPAEPAEAPEEPELLDVTRIADDPVIPPMQEKRVSLEKTPLTLSDTLREQEDVANVPDRPAPDPAPKPEESAPVKPEKPVKEKPVKEKPAKKQKPEEPAKEIKKVGAGRRVLAVLLSILLVLFLLTGTMGYAVRRATTEEGLKAVLEDVDVASIQVAPFFDDVEEELSLSEMLSEDLGYVGLKIGESSVAKIINSSGMKGYAAEQAAQLIADIYRGHTRYEFDPETLKTELLEGKTARVLQKEKVSLSQKEADKVTQMLVDYGVADSLSRDALKSEAPELVHAVNIGLSWPVIIGLLALALAMIVLIFIANRGRIGLSFGDIGGAALAVGLV